MRIASCARVDRSSDRSANMNLPTIAKRVALGSSLLILVSMPVASRAQVTEAWNTYFDAGYNQNNASIDFCKDSQDNIYSLSKTDANGKTYWVVRKTAPLGNKVWQKAYSLALGSSPTAITVDLNGNV